MDRGERPHGGAGAMVSFYCPICQADVEGDYEADVEDHRVEAGHPTAEMIRQKFEYLQQNRGRVPKTDHLDGPVVCVTGPLGSGTRLLTRLIAESGVKVLHDQWHATQDKFIRDPRITHVVAIFRDPVVTLKVMTARHGGGSIEETEAGLQERAPNALRVSYEKLMNDPETVIAAIAAYIGVAPWTISEVLEEQNSKWANGPAPEIHTPPTLLLPLPDWY